MTSQGIALIVLAVVVVGALGLGVWAAVSLFKAIVDVVTWRR